MSLELDSHLKVLNMYVPIRVLCHRVPLISNLSLMLMYLFRNRSEKNKIGKQSWKLLLQMATDV